MLDFFGGSGTTGAAALELELERELELELERRFLLVDQNPEAISTMQRRFADADVNFVDA